MSIADRLRLGQRMSAADLIARIRADEPSAPEAPAPARPPERVPESETAPEPNSRTPGRAWGPPPNRRKP